MGLAAKLQLLTPADEKCLLVGIIYSFYCCFIVSFPPQESSPPPYIAKMAPFKSFNEALRDRRVVSGYDVQTLFS